ncbi:MAG: UdgX family uracil-DNA binding protein [Gammaproteobacteria bacterium]
MKQPSLFDQLDDPPGQRSFRFVPEFEAWFRCARQALAQGVAPAQAWWCEDAQAPCADPVDSGVAIPRFTELAVLGACHRSADRWALMYRIFWRLNRSEPELCDVAADPDIARLMRYAAAVRRDRHKMKAFVRFREVNDGQADPRYVAWFEPDHNIVALTAPFFVRRFTNMRWSILSPELCAHWEGSGKVWFSSGVDKSAAPESDQLEDAWRVYYKSIFNPARLKTNAMRAEMPQKYWKNLPEAHLIPELIRDANQRVASMQQAIKTEDVLQCGPRPQSPQAQRTVSRQRAAPQTLDRLHLEIAECRECPHAERTTQAVLGEGAANARVMIVGEQPGDQEDLQGRPFVGPSGELLDAALAACDQNRAALYLTNAVKHFTFEERGRRRLHRTPTIESVRTCSAWLRREIALVDPVTVICLGRTAARSVLGASVDISRQRGRNVRAEDRNVVCTVHPAWLLRLSYAQQKRREFERWVDDLRYAFGL